MVLDKARLQRLLNLQGLQIFPSSFSRPLGFNREIYIYIDIVTTVLANFESGPPQCLP
jgi:hypothetical protein